MSILRKITAIMLIVIMLFSSCMADTLNLPTGLTVIGKEAFYGDTSLEKVVVPEGVKEIESKAFANTLASEVDLPDSVTFIADDAFDQPGFVELKAPRGSYAYNWAVDNGYINEVKTAQSLLVSLNLLSQNDVTGEYDSLTKRAVSFFQYWASRHQYDEVKQTGLLNNETIAAMEDSVDQGTNLKSAYVEYVQNAADMLLSGELSMEDINMETIDILDVSEFTDPEILELIKQVNDIAVQKNDAVSEFNDYISEMYTGFKTFSDDIFETIYSENGDTIFFSYGDMDLVMDSQLLERLGGNSVFSAAELSEDGDILTVSLEGKNYFISVDNNTIYFTDSQISARSSSAEQFRLVSRGASESGYKLFYSKLAKLGELWGIIDASMIKAIEKAEEDVLLQTELTEYYKKLASRNDYFEPHYQRELKILTKDTGRLNTLNGVSAALNFLSIPSQLESGKNLLKNWKEVNRIAEHHHPTDEDFMNDFTDIADQLARDIIATQILYTTTAISSLWSLVTTSATIVGFIASCVPALGIVVPAALTATSLGTALVTMAGTIYLDQIGSEKYNAVIEGEGKLHSRVSGYIKDSVTNQPLDNVTVTSGTSITRTDENGYYRLPLQPGRYTITFKRYNYGTVTQRIDLKSNEKKQIDLSLIANITVTGTVYSIEEGNLITPPLGGVSVYLLTGAEKEYCTVTDSNGKYSALVPAGSVTLYFEKDGYQSASKTFTCKVNGSNDKKDISLVKEPKPTPTPTSTPTPTASPTPTPTPTPISDNPYAIGDVPIDAAHFPDPVFREYVKQFDDGWWEPYFDENGEIKEELIGKNDGILSEIERWDATSIDVDGTGIYSLEGLKYFTLNFLNCANNKIESLDVSCLSRLTELTCDNNLITSLDVSQNKGLMTLNCDKNKLTTLYANGLMQLTYLSCNDNEIDSIDICGCSNLQNLYCRNNNISSLDVSDCTNLYHLYCDSNHLSCIDVSGFEELETLSCRENQLTSLEIVGCQSLKTLDCYGNRLTSLIFSGYDKIEDINAYYNDLKTIDVSQCAGLRNLNIVYGNDQCESINVEDCASLLELLCWGKQLNSLDVKGCGSLQTLSCEHNKIEEIDLSGLVKLQYLYCSDNYLTNLDVSQCTELKTLSCSGNHMLYLDVSACNGIEVLEASMSDAFFTDSEFDLSIVSDLDVSKVTIVDGGYLDGTTLVFDNSWITYNSDNQKCIVMNYQYDTGNGFALRRRLLLLTDEYADSEDDDNPNKDFYFEDDLYLFGEARDLSTDGWFSEGMYTFTTKANTAMIEQVQNYGEIAGNLFWSSAITGDYSAEISINPEIQGDSAFISFSLSEMPSREGKLLFEIYHYNWEATEDEDKVDMILHCQINLLEAPKNLPVDILLPKEVNVPIGGTQFVDYGFGGGYDVQNVLMYDASNSYGDVRLYSFSEEKLIITGNSEGTFEISVRVMITQSSFYQKQMTVHVVPAE